MLRSTFSPTVWVLLAAYLLLPVMGMNNNRPRPDGHSQGQNLHVPGGPSRQELARPQMQPRPHLSTAPHIPSRLSQSITAEPDRPQSLFSRLEKWREPRPSQDAQRERRASAPQTGNAPVNPLAHKPWRHMRHSSAPQIRNFPTSGDVGRSTPDGENRGPYDPVAKLRILELTTLGTFTGKSLIAGRVGTAPTTLVRWCDTDGAFRYNNRVAVCQCYSDRETLLRVINTHRFMLHVNAQRRIYHSKASSTIVWPYAYGIQPMLYPELKPLKSDYSSVLPTSSVYPRDSPVFSTSSIFSWSVPLSTILVHNENMFTTNEYGGTSNRWRGCIVVGQPQKMTTVAQFIKENTKIAKASAAQNIKLAKASATRDTKTSKSTAAQSTKTSKPFAAQNTEISELAIISKLMLPLLQNMFESLYSLYRFYGIIFTWNISRMQHLYVYDDDSGKTMLAIQDLSESIVTIRRYELMMPRPREETCVGIAEYQMHLFLFAQQLLPTLVNDAAGLLPAIEKESPPGLKEVELLKTNSEVAMDALIESRQDQSISRRINHLGGKLDQQSSGTGQALIDFLQLARKLSGMFKVSMASPLKSSTIASSSTSRASLNQ